MTDATAPAAPSGPGPAAAVAGDAGELPPSGGPLSPWRTVVRSAGARVFVLPLSAVLGVLSTRLIIENFGRDAYAQYGLLVAIGTLLPFADLGMSAAIMNAVGGSDRPGEDPYVRGVLVTSVRVLLCSAAVLLGITATITALGWWPTLLGDGLLPGAGALVAGLCLGLIAITLPVAFGQRVLTGLGKNHVQIAIFGLQTPVVLAVLLVVVAVGGGSGAFLPVIPYVVVLVLSVGACVMAARHVRPAMGQALRDVPRVRRVRGERVSDVAWPMLVQMVALPIAMQSDRLVLSHLAGPGELAEYNLAAQMYLPVWQVATAAGASLWPVFARARARGERRTQSPVPIALGFAGVAAVVCALITAAVPLLSELASGGRVRIPWGLAAVFAVFMVLQAGKYPLGMFMTDAPGLRYQAVMIVIMVPVNLGLSIALARHLGAAGPVLGSLVGVLLFQVVANGWYVRRAMAGTL
jgi:O-antigen/teichoic acid export membrane protein